MKPFAAILGLVQGSASALWTFPSVLGSAMLIAWAAEAAQFLISQGLALAVLAWLQTLPEFAVEAAIAWDAGKAVQQGPGTPEALHATALMTANFTGSLRLLVGLGWPMIYVTAAMFYRKKRKGALKDVKLEREHAVEVVFLLICIAYFFIVWLKGSLSLFDTVILSIIYGVYLFFLKKIPPQDEEKVEDLDRIPQYILARSPRVRNALIIGLFASGGLILYFVAHPFLDSLKALATTLGLSSFVFVQWVAPFLSEFPEKVSAFNWARRVTTAPVALMNMVSSNVNQWTMLVAMLPIAYSLALGEPATIAFDEHQRVEILMTICQSLLGALILANMRFAWWEAAVLFTLWFIQFVLSGFERPALDAGHNSIAMATASWLKLEVEHLESFATEGKHLITAAYLLWSAVIVISSLTQRKVFEAFRVFPRLIREHW
ncbi:MAG TPA: sodium:calcium antiporter [Blastocatellia bacterium]|nr:sodium:calcium antiporter [Blastocatellia bacterium]